jgi:hypothetical protein
MPEIAVTAATQLHHAMGHDPNLTVPVHPITLNGP